MNRNVRSVLVLLLTVFVAGLTAACGNVSKESHGGHEGHSHSSSESAEVQTPPKVKFDLPEQATAGTPTTLKVTITHEGKPVNDADDVQFEVWEKGAGKNEHEKLPAEFKGDGIYQVKKTFNEPGTYRVMYHVTAKGSHVMKPARTLEVQAESKE
ncbi:YtkA-like protein [Melghirimyces profundicolus]|uniref:YtkA-like protein n=1 Tax=Melghirimyces profundicolus TaxID=1242148 RepID=A0A2T6BV79_9BACL|nr:FixH family protein [Melghirimyces profundicolus]PTX59973.1 YtkA-like protein [Melghirimyces profundicolus]